MVPETGNFIIYGLTEPGDITNLRYVGKTKNLKSRVNGHWNHSRGTCHRTNWIKKLKAAGTKFEVIILDRCDTE